MVSFMEGDIAEKMNLLVPDKIEPNLSHRKSIYDSEYIRNSLGTSSSQLIKDEDQGGGGDDDGAEDDDDDPPDSGQGTVQNIFQTSSEKKPKEKTEKNSNGEPLEQQLTNEKLRQLEEIFSEADEDGGGGLDMEEFRVAMRTQLGDITDAELDKIFMKVDTNCDGTVDWDEYLTYMLLECQGQDTMNIQARQPFPRYVATVQSPHRDSIIRILFLSSIRTEGTDSRECKFGRYMTIGQDGIVCVWNTSLHLLGSHRIQPEAKNVWVTDATYLTGIQVVAISATSRDIFLYDVSANRFHLTKRITNLNSCALTLHYWNDIGGNKFQVFEGGICRFVQAILMWGDSDGGLATVYFYCDPFHTFLCSKFDHKDTRRRVPFPELLQNQLPGVSAIYRPQLHGDLIRQVMFCPHLSCTISCCKDSDTAMFVGGTGLKLTSSYFKVKRGIDTFDYTPSLNVIVTGGYDGLVRIWNPYVPAKPVIRLDGHQFPVHHVKIDTARENVVSISEIKEIRVHDLTTQTCIQTIYKNMIIGMGPRPVSAMFLNQSRQTLIFATNILASLENEEEESVSVELVSHDKPISHALYNPLFEQVVSIGIDSLVCVWSITTGEKLMQFKAHKVRRNGVIMDVEVTAMTFDPTFRRLITGAKNGDIRIWNFNNGACLRVLPKFDNLEITSLSCPNHNIITAGWNRRISKYVDSADDDSVRWLKLYHQDDIHSISHYNGSILASGSYDGNILIWSLATGRLLFCLNGSVSHKQLRAATYFKMIKDIDTIDNEDMEDPEVKKPSKAKFGQNSPNVKKDFNGTKEPSNAISDKNVDDNGHHSIKGNSIQKLLFLESRESDIETATLLAACADGSVQAWSMHHKSGLLGQFPAAHLPETCVTGMVSDKEDFVLITSDSGGYVKVFDISNYCVADAEEQEQSEDYIQERELWYNRFPFLVWAQSVMSHSESGMKSWIRQYNSSKEKRPPVLNSYRAHLQSISSIDLVSTQGLSLIMTASVDRSVRLWTIDGQFIGIFGQKRLWDMSLMHPIQRTEFTVDVSKSKSIYRNRKVLMPPDVRRVGSAATLMVLNGGRRPAWKLCSNIIKWLFMALAPKPQSHVPESAKLERASSFHLVTEDVGKTPSILGSTYTRLTKHHPLPPIPPVRYNGITEVVSVYGSLHCHDLDELVTPIMPDSVKSMLNNQRKQQRMEKEAHNIKNKMKVIKVFKDSTNRVKTVLKMTSGSRTSRTSFDGSADQLSQPPSRWKSISQKGRLSTHENDDTSKSKKEIENSSHNMRQPSKNNMKDRSRSGSSSGVLYETSEEAIQTTSPTKPEPKLVAISEV